MNQQADQNDNSQQAGVLENSFLVVDGVRLDVTRYPGRLKKAPTLVLLHEGLGCIAMWKDFPEKLAARTGYPVFVYSRQGYGRSDPWSMPPGLDYMHREGLEILPKVLAMAAITNYILVGHSDGGSIALIHAGSCVSNGPLAIVTMAAHVFCEPLTVESIAKAQENYQTLGINKGLAKYHFDKTDELFRGWSNNWLTADFMHWTIEHYLSAIAVPQLVIQGYQDQYGTLKQVEAIKNQSAGEVEVVLFDDCGHSAYKEQQALTLEAIAGFVKRITAAEKV